MFVHHVFFWLNNPDSEEDKGRLLQGLKQLESIDVIRTFHTGVPATTNRDVIERGYALSLLMIFDSLEDQETYQVHPVHKAFVEKCSSLWSKVVVYDAVDA
jgi:hypothetical protein